MKYILNIRDLDNKVSKAIIEMDNTVSKKELRAFLSGVLRGYNLAVDCLSEKEDDKSLNGFDDYNKLMMIKELLEQEYNGLFKSIKFLETSAEVLDIVI